MQEAERWTGVEMGGVAVSTVRAVARPVTVGVGHYCRPYTKSHCHLYIPAMSREKSDS
jgi:hypothetical protein